jgi:8-oxo-dGTP pyrophosphatase MutT (NUDIX family)
MPIPDFIVALREKVGHAPLWLSGVTAVVHRCTGDAREVLLVRRADNGEWTSVTGVIDPGEEPAVAAAREVLEEARVVAVPERLAWVHVLPPMTYDNGDRAQYIDVVFALRYESGVAAVGDDENTDAGWFRLDALPEMSASHRERIREALEGGPEARFGTDG